MQIDRDQVIDFLRRRGDADRAGEAERVLPEVVDTHEHRGLLAQLGVDVDDLTAGGIGGLLGKD